MTVLRFDGHNLSIERVYEVDGAWTAPYCEVAKECTENLQMEVVQCIGMPLLAKASWYPNQIFVFSRSDGQDIDLQKLTEVYKRTFGE